MLRRAPLGRIVNDLCFLPDNVFSIGCILSVYSIRIQYTVLGYTVSSNPRSGISAGL